MRKFGILFMTLGLFWGFFAWQNVGTDTSESQNEAVKIITQNLEADTVRPVPLPWTQRDTTSGNTDVKIIVKSPPAEPKKIKVDGKYVASVGLLSIPSIGVKNEAVVDDFTQAALDEGLIASTGTPPGSIGNFVVIGHVVTHGEVFTDLKKLRKGDTVTIKTASGTFTYRIRGGPVTIVDTDTWVLRDNPSKTKGLKATRPVLTLLTCAERFHSNKRIAIFGDLVKGTP